ncbi:hypothetical protein [Bradyrhizobium sp. CB3481]|uniref:phage major capsid protein n=1 Tax=Bradyrhizobium sp. CB3481 TaxID=3039158 RepID=UPI0024B148BF|nr:hypothetical protein [Bradyrhizobium sp. CB3481]WFU14425.1 hypothetical protein QA643_24930 [Bradyrhizobium sp. CB3481]
MSDNQPLFHTSHKNKEATTLKNFNDTTPTADALLGAGRLALRKQVGLTGVEYLTITPKFLVVPSEQETAAEKGLAIVAPTKTADFNPFSGKLELVVDPRLTSATRWYLAADRLPIVCEMRQREPAKPLICFASFEPVLGMQPANLLQSCQQGTAGCRLDETVGTTMLHRPISPGEFAKYTTKDPREILLGYEYEIDWPYAGPPAALLDRTFHPIYTGTDGDDFYDVDDMPIYIKLPRGDKRVDRKAMVNPIRILPPYFQVRYEPLGHSSGYEIKSAIAPMSIHKRLIKRILFKGVSFNEHPNGPKNDGGIHVSINRDYTVNPLKDKVFPFAHNFPRQALLKISERQPETLDLYAQQHPDCPAKQAERYSVLNTANSNRFEFRLFAAQKHLLIPAIEMADSLFNAARDIEELTVETWTNYINSKVKYVDIAQHVRSKLNA